MNEPYISYFGFENLEVYPLALEFVGNIYRLSNPFPKSEQFGLSNQTQRAAVSITLNIAEGRGRDNDKEFIRFLNIARGSLLEAISALGVAVQLGYVSRYSTPTGKWQPNQRQNQHSNQSTRGRQIGV